LKGRYRDSKDINYPFTIEESKLGKNLELEVDFDGIIENGYDIIVLNHQPGIGKTTAVMNYIKNKLEENNDFRFFYFTDKHKTIEENISKHFQTIYVTHWRGFEYFTTYKNAIKLYKDYHLDAKTINESTPIGKNTIGRYTNQFNKAHEYGRVFAPFNYLKGNHFRQIKKNIVFLDENISQLITFTFDEKITTIVFKAISNEEGEKWITELQKRNFHYFMNKDIQKEIIESYKNAILKAYQNEKENKGLLDLLEKFNPFDFKEFIRLGSIYKWKENSYSFPLYYYGAFDEIIKGTPLVILDASFNENLFSYFLESYNGEIRELGYGKGFKDLNVYVLKSNHQNPDTVIYRMHPRGALSKSSVLKYQDETTKNISGEIKKIIEVFGIENVGIITFKDIAKHVKVLGIDIEYFGNLRGTNILEGKSVLIVIGAWLPIPPSKPKPEEEKKKQGLESLIWNNFLIDIKDISYVEAFASAPQTVIDENKEVKLAEAHISIEKKFKDSDSMADITEMNPISMMNMQFYAEAYQAYHRNRGLRNNKIIFSFGWFPEPNMLLDKSVKEPFFKYDLRKEFSVEKIFSESDLDRILQPYKDIFNRWKSFILDIDDKSKSNTDIANKYKIWRGPAGGPNVPLIEEIRKNIHWKFKEELDKSK